MKRFLLLVLCISAFQAYSQNRSDEEPRGLFDKKKKVALSANEPTPSKGDQFIICDYTLPADSLFKKISGDLLAFGYSIDKKDSDLFYLTTGEKPVKHLVYTMRVIVKGQQVKLNALYKSAVGFQFGNVKTEQTASDVKFTSKMYVTRDVFDEMIKFAQSTSPQKIHFEK
ncbi:hypothetical protein HF324_18580 [Chitinophaga oryzae]|uniref:DUF4468 domain-containing protein n=1 Tax=Chitinophaga oryzae TaxID=2725414 RepID=A0ABX6LI16_9BACT|nr:hypothetical protein [Chitinophaga oryzae]QJB39755.1 hypothetical protein HF324_18580 [Chitinophaga oryzae]